VMMLMLFAARTPMGDLDICPRKVVSGGPIFASKTRTEVESISHGSKCVPPQVFRSEDPTLGTTTVVPESNS
jgi:hypothetical protein